MQITKEMLEARKAQFIAAKDQIIAQANMIGGAINDTDELLAILAQEEPKEVPAAAPQPSSPEQVQEPI